MKRKIFLIALFVTFWNYSKAQNFEIGVMDMSGMTAKTEGQIKISDSLVTIVTGGKTLEYKLLKKVNGLTYFTDGVMTHYFTFLEKVGKKKGFEFDTMIFFNPDKNFLPSIITYWCKKRE